MTVRNSQTTISCQGKPFQVALISMPWAIFNRPSIQLGALNAYLTQNYDWISVRNFHPYLQVANLLGHQRYHAVSMDMWRCESLYAPLVFPEVRDGARDIFQKRSGGNSHKIDFDDTLDLLSQQVEGFIDGLDWREFDLVGFSICFNQLFSTLAAVKRLKGKNSSLPVVLGGSACSGDLARAMLATAGADFIVAGEGENDLAAICEFLSGRKESLPPGVHGKKRGLAGVAVSQERPAQLRLSKLPCPDYDDYFHDMRRIKGGEVFIPALPVEFSRGCWWRKCAFCNLNLQWSGYRSKVPKQMQEEVLSLSEKHGCLDFYFTDNALPVKAALEFFKDLHEGGRDFSFFAEIRVNMRGEKLAQCSQGGLKTIQVGIEALSTRLLQSMDKGTTVIENIAVMRDAVSCGIVLEGNLIVGFPGSTAEQVAETLKNLDFVLPFNPLTTAAFFLGHGSPMEKHPHDYGISSVITHPQFKKLFPAAAGPSLPVLIKGYRGDKAKQRQAWLPVVKKVEKWQEFHARRGETATCKPALSYQDGGTFIVIRQELPDRPVLHHTLRGVSRKMYLACTDICTIPMLEKKFPQFTGPQIIAFLDDLVQKRVVFQEENKYLSLAVRSR